MSLFTALKLVRNRNTSKKSGYKKFQQVQYKTVPYCLHHFNKFHMISDQWLINVGTRSNTCECNQPKKNEKLCSFKCYRIYDHLCTAETDCKGLLGMTSSFLFYITENLPPRPLHFTSSSIKKSIHFKWNIYYVSCVFSPL